MTGFTRWMAMGTALALVACGLPAAFGQSTPSAETDVSSSSSAPADDGSVASAPADEAAAKQAALADIEASLSLSKDRADQLKQEIANMKGDREQQNAALIAAGQRMKLAEADVNAVEQKLGDLIVAELQTRGRLDGADGTISNVLAALERISRNPPPALIVDPSDALGSARSAMLISAILPQLKSKADRMIADLQHLAQIKTEAQAEEQELKANFEILEEEQLRIATLIQAKKQNEQTANTNLAVEEADAAALAAKATSLKQLIDDLQKRAAAVQTAADATARANAGDKAPRLDADTIRMALANTKREQPAVPFAQAHGYLTMPSNGVDVIDYGAGDGFGGIAKGLSIVTRAEADVVAPADGWVLYKGPYLNYGQIIILDAGQDYTILLAGLNAISVDVGQFVLMGEPVGTMGSRTIGRTVATSAGASRPTLYIEMRKDNEPVDPTGWWANPANPTPSNPTQTG